MKSPPSGSGALIARALFQSWRDAPPPLSAPLSPAQLAVIAPMVVRSGGGSLLMRRLAAAPTSDHAAQPPPAAIDDLRQCHRRQTLDGALYLRALERVLRALADRGVAPLLIKGWSVARLYPHPALRPSSDIDLIVSPTEEAVAREVIAEHRDVAVDLHTTLSHLSRRNEAELLRRVQTVPFGKLEVRLLGDEDQLHLLCLHLLVHGGQRTIWLADLAVCVERAGPSFDWAYLLAGDGRDAAAVRVALGLAATVLGANLAGTPVAEAPAELPAWMKPALFAQWERDEIGYLALKQLPRGPRAFLREARRRWPNPIRATAALRAPYNEWPRWPIQCAEYLLRAVQHGVGARPPHAH